MLTEAMPVKVMQICVYLHLLFCQRPIVECLGSLTENRISRLLDTHFGSNDSERRKNRELLLDDSIKS